jgi:hypothetical protein
MLDPSLVKCWKPFRHDSLRCLWNCSNTALITARRISITSHRCWSSHGLSLLSAAVRSITRHWLCKELFLECLIVWETRESNFSSILSSLIIVYFSTVYEVPRLCHMKLGALQWNVSKSEPLSIQKLSYYTEPGSIYYILKCLPDRTEFQVRVLDIDQIYVLSQVLFLHKHTFLKKL